MTAAPRLPTGVDSSPGAHGSGPAQSSHPWDQRTLIWSFAQRDLKARYKGTTIGWAWSLIVPVATVLIYTIVFSVIFRAQPPDFGSGRAGIFAVWFVTGLVPWALLSGAVTAGMPSLLGSGSLLQKIYIPSYVPVLGTVVAIGVQSLIEFSLVLVLLAVFGNISWTWLLLPAWLAVFVVFVASITYVLAVCNVYLRDLNQIIAVLLQLLFFCTPIMYPLTLIPDTANGVPLRALIEANPIAQFVFGFRAVLYDLTVPSLLQWGYVAAWTVVALGLALWVFRRWGRDVSEDL